MKILSRETLAADQSIAAATVAHELTNRGLTHAVVDDHDQVGVMLRIEPLTMELHGLPHECRHTHVASQSVTEAFWGPIPDATENRAAHGNVCVTETCACGAGRQTNVNQQYRETGPWFGPE